MATAEIATAKIHPLAIGSENQSERVEQYGPPAKKVFFHAARLTKLDMGINYDRTPRFGDPSRQASCRSTAIDSLSSFAISQQDLFCAAKKPLDLLDCLLSRSL